MKQELPEGKGFTKTEQEELILLNTKDYISSLRKSADPDIIKERIDAIPDIIGMKD